MAFPLPQGQPAATDLLVQQGGSCWLFVIEALARPKAIQAGLDASCLRMAMYAYPDREEVEERQKASSLARRTIALELMQGKISNMLGRLRAYQANTDNPQLPRISLAAVKKFARAEIGSDQSVNFISFPGGNDPAADVAAVIAAYDKALRCAGGLLELALEVDGAGDAGQAEYDAIAARLLNSGCGVIDSAQELQDTRTALEVQNKPCYISVHKRFRAGQDIGQVIDYTGLPASQLADSSHALLLESYDPGNDIVTYKDPNYGNVTFRITAGQFRAMAGKFSINMHPFIARGKNPSALAGILEKAQ